jgi:anti-sigma regulatory factor (Ser/Thr protein kinase)
MDASATFWFPCDVGECRTARQVIREFLGSSGWRGSHDDAIVIVSELFENAVRHAHSDVRLLVRLDGPLLHMEVHDRDHSTNVRVTPATSAGGYGLRLIQSLSCEWGWSRDTEGKVVWAELLAIPT